MSDRKIMRLGSSENTEPLKDEREGMIQKLDAEGKEVQPVEKTVESILVESLDALERQRIGEKEQARLMFALDRFCMHGGQELINIFGAEKVLDAVQDLTQTQENLRITLLDVVKKLAPDSKERQKVYEQMEQQAEDFVSQKEEEDQKLAAGNNESAYKRFWDIYHRGVSASADGNTLRAKQLNISLLRSTDSVTGSLVSVFSNLFKNHNPLEFPTKSIVQEALSGNLEKLKKELNNPDHEDPLVTLYEMDIKIEKDDADRIREAIKIYKKADSEIRKITLEVNNELASKVNKILEDLQITLSKYAGSEEGDKMIASIAVTVQKDIESFQQTADKEIEGKTAKFKEIRDRASTATRPYWQ